MLDTSVVRGVIHGDPEAVDLTALQELKGDRPVSIADGAVAELAAALLGPKGIAPELWKTRVAAFDDVLDP